MGAARTVLLFVSVVLAAAGVRAQVYAVPDSDSYEENPRFLLAGQADEAIAEERYDDAAARLIEAISICPDCPDNALLLSNLGMVYAYAGRDSLALETLDRALELSPAMKTVMANRARVLLRMGRDRSAYEAFSAVIDADSLNTEARYYRGMMALYSGDAATAENDFNVLRDSLPLENDTARAMAALLSLTGRNAQAVPYFRQLVREDPSPEYYAALAGCLLADAKLTEASEVIGEGMGKYPDDAELFYYRAWLNRDLFRLSEARSDGRRAVELGIPESKVRRLLGK